MSCAETFRRHSNWKTELAAALGEKYDVLAPRMPNSYNARYTEWKLWMDRVAGVIHTETILIGHSLGVIFLAKYLSENTFPQKIIGVILVSAPFDDDDDESQTGESINDFALPASLDGLAAHAEKVYLLHSKDDPIVPYAQLAHYQKLLSKAKTISFEDRGHFNQETFPEIVELIRSF